MEKGKESKREAAIKNVHPTRHYEAESRNNLHKAQPHVSCRPVGLSSTTPCEQNCWLMEARRSLRIGVGLYIDLVVVKEPALGLLPGGLVHFASDHINILSS